MVLGMIIISAWVKKVDAIRRIPNKIIGIAPKKIIGDLGIRVFASLLFFKGGEVLV